MTQFEILATSQDHGFKTHWDIYNIGNGEVEILQVQRIDCPDDGIEPLESDEQARILALLHGIVKPETLHTPLVEVDGH